MNEYVISFINDEGVYQQLTFRGVTETVAADVKGIMRLEEMTDVELQVEHSHNRANHLDNLDWDEYDLNDREDYYYGQGLIEALLEHRRVQRQYTGHGPLTHTPFAVLAAAGL